MTRVSLIPCIGAGFLTLWLLALLPSEVWAAGANMPWEQPLTNVLNSLSGPVARAIGIIAVTIFGLGMAFTEGGGMRGALSILLGLSIAFSATGFFLTFFGFAGGVVF